MPAGSRLSRTARRAELSKVVHDLVDCLHVRDVNTRLSFMDTLDAALKTPDKQDWVVYFEEGILPAICNLVFQEEFCGFSISEILSWKEDMAANANNMIWVLWMINQYAICLTSLKEVSHYPELREIREIVKYPLSRPIDFWGTLHRLREVLLVDHSQFTGLDITSIYLTFAEMPQNYVVFLKDPRNDLAEIEVSLVMLWIWTRSDDELVRSRALKHWLDCMGMLASPFFPPRPHWPPMLERAFDGTITPSTVAACMRRDLLDTTHLDDIYYSDVCICFHIRPHLSPEAADIFDRSVLLLAVAAAHRQICVGLTNVTKRNLSAVLLYVGLVLDRPFRHKLSELNMHSILVLFIHSVDYTLSGNSSISTNTADSFGLCESTLRKHRIKTIRVVVPEPLRQIRLFSFKFWSGLTEKFGRRVTANSTTSFARSWNALGKTLEALTMDPGDPSRNGTPFPPLKRCGWERCFCSVHRPAHPMRLCTGCAAVAYCGPRCQANDWRDGGHKRTCASMIFH